MGTSDKLTFSLKRWLRQNMSTALWKITTFTVDYVWLCHPFQTHLSIKHPLSSSTVNHNVQPSAHDQKRWPEFPLFFSCLLCFTVPVSVAAHSFTTPPLSLFLLSLVVLIYVNPVYKVIRFPSCFCLIIIFWGLSRVVTADNSQQCCYRYVFSVL